VSLRGACRLLFDDIANGHNLARGRCDDIPHADCRCCHATTPTFNAMSCFLSRCGVHRGTKPESLIRKGLACNLSFIPPVVAAHRVFNGARARLLQAPVGQTDRLLVVAAQEPRSAQCENSELRPSWRPTTRASAKRGCLNVGFQPRAERAKKQRPASVADGTAVESRTGTTSMLVPTISTSAAAPTGRPDVLECGAGDIPSRHEFRQFHYRIMVCPGECLRAKETAVRAGASRSPRFRWPFRETPPFVHGHVKSTPLSTASLRIKTLGR